MRRAENLATSVRNSFDDIAGVLQADRDRVGRHLARLEAESVRRDKAAVWQLHGLAAAALVLCLVGGLVGWKMKSIGRESEILALETKTQENLKEVEIFGLYILEKQPKVAERYWKEMVAWRRGKRH